MIALSRPNEGKTSTSCRIFNVLNSCLDGRVTFALVENPGQEATVELKYQLLNPAPNFLEVVNEARAVVLAGGTMSPVSCETPPYQNGG